MTVTFAVNQNNDIYIGADGNLAIWTGIAAVEGACASASKAQLGEMVLAVTSGMPTFQTIWNGTPNLAIYESYLRAAILAVDGVLSVVSLAVSVESGVFKYTATISSTFGLIEINGGS